MDGSPQAPVLNSDNRYVPVYEREIQDASGPIALQDAQLNIEDAERAEKISSEEAAALKELLCAKVQNEFSVAAKAVCPGGPGACKYGIEVSLDDAKINATLKTCRTHCAERVNCTLFQQLEALDDVQRTKRRRVEMSKNLAGIHQILVDSFEK